ncbi:MAG: hypothetical protein ACERKZ_11220 [Lachnotalea sp.]
MGKKYVDIITEFTVEGILIPKALRNIEDKIQNIDEIIHIEEKYYNQKVAMTSYKCIISNQVCYLYYMGNNTWFMDEIFLC